MFWVRVISQNLVVLSLEKGVLNLDAPQMPPRQSSKVSNARTIYVLYAREIVLGNNRPLWGLTLCFCFLVFDEAIRSTTADFTDAA
jgi:hypothetical protein